MMKEGMKPLDWKGKGRMRCYIQGRERQTENLTITVHVIFFFTFSVRITILD